MRRFALAALLLAAPAAAQPADSADPSVLSLTDAQRQSILDHNTEDSAFAAQSGLGSGAPSRQIHGEVGVMIGSRGSRGAYGTAAIPLGANAEAAVSFESSRYGRAR